MRSAGSVRSRSVASHSRHAGCASLTCRGVGGEPIVGRGAAPAGPFGPTGAAKDTQEPRAVGSNSRHQMSGARGRAPSSTQRVEKNSGKASEIQGITDRLIHRTAPLPAVLSCRCRSAAMFSGAALTPGSLTFSRMPAFYRSDAVQIERVGSRWQRATDHRLGQSGGRGTQTPTQRGVPGSCDPCTQSVPSPFLSLREGRDDSTDSCQT